MNKFTVRPNKSVKYMIEVTKEAKELKRKENWMLDDFLSFTFSTEKIANALSRAGIKTTRELISLNFLEVKAIKGVGIKAQQEIISYMDANKFKFKPHPDGKLNNRCSFEIYLIRERAKREEQKEKQKREVRGKKILEDKEKQAISDASKEFQHRIKAKYGSTKIT